MAQTHDISVIMPTQGLRAREALLWRAIESVLGQKGVRTVPIVVLNGQEADPTIETRLHSDPRLRVVRMERASLPGSLVAGREAVDTPWFGELDDDDELLPGALSLRVGYLAEDPDLDVVVTNGFRGTEGGRVLHIDDMAAVGEDPLRSLPRKNWLLPGSWACRTETVSSRIFKGMPNCSECTFLAIQFCTKLRTRFLQEPTVVWYTDTPASASKSPDYRLSGPPGLRRILELDLPPDVRATYRRKMSDELHGVADWHRLEGRVGQAWRHHLASIRWPGGWRYIPFTRRLLFRPPRS